MSYLITYTGEVLAGVRGTPDINYDRVEFSHLVGAHLELYLMLETMTMHGAGYATDRVLSWDFLDDRDHEAQSLHVKRRGHFVHAHSTETPLWFLATLNSIELPLE